MSSSLLETRKIKYEIACQTCQKLVAVFWYQFSEPISGKCVMCITSLKSADRKLASAHLTS